MPFLTGLEPARVLCADPPWPFKDKLPGKKRGAASNYPVLPMRDLLAYPLPPLLPDAILFLWKVASMPQEALDVVRAWGFRPKAEMVWVKLTPRRNLAFGMGHYVRNCHESCIIATRGRPKVASRRVRSVILAPAGLHSAKPEAFYDAVEELCGRGPRVELFARRQREGWTCLGLESEQRPRVRSLRLFDEAT